MKAVSDNARERDAGSGDIKREMIREIQDDIAQCLRGIGNKVQAHSGAPKA